MKMIKSGMETDSVRRGVLIHSSEESSATFIPTVPELFHYK